VIIPLGLRFNPKVVVFLSRHCGFRVLGFAVKRFFSSPCLL
jgi:hypothetical protein